MTFPGSRRLRVDSDSRKQVVGVLLLLAALAAIMVAVTLVVVAWGAKDEPVIGGALGSAASFVGVLATAGMAFYAHSGGKGDGKRQSAHSWSWRWISPISALVVCVAAVPVYWYGIHRPDLPVTDRVVLAPSGGVLQVGGPAASSQVVLWVPGAPRRNNLALTLVLTNVHSWGDCVSPARLKIVPFVDGTARAEVDDVRSGREVKIPLTGATRSVWLRVNLVTENDRSCEVKPSVKEATLFN